MGIAVARRVRPTGLQRAWGTALWLLGALIALSGLAQLALLVLSQERLVAEALQNAGPPPVAALEEVALPGSELSAAGRAVYPVKARNLHSPWGCAAFDLDQATPPGLGAAAVAVSLAPRPARRDLVGYRLVSGEATDTLIPDLDYFATCLETGRPEQVVETPARRSSPAFPASRWAMGPVELDVAVRLTSPEASPVRLRIDVARSAPDPSPYVEALPAMEPFGAVWLLDHGVLAVSDVRVMGRLAPSRCERLGGAGAPPRFARFAYDADAAGEGLSAPLTDPRRRLFDLSEGLAEVPEAAAMAAWRACVGLECESLSAFMERNQTLAAAGFCDPQADAIWRLRLDARLTSPNAADPQRPFVSVVSALGPLEPPGPLTAAAVYRTPASQNGGLRSRGEAYAIITALPQAGANGAYALRVRLAAPETSTHLFRIVALDGAGAALGSSRWTHLLAFAPQAAAPAPVALAPAQPDRPITPAAVSPQGGFAAIAASAEDPLPNP